MHDPGTIRMLNLSQEEKAKYVSGELKHIPIFGYREVWEITFEASYVGEDTVIVMLDKDKTPEDYIEHLKECVYDGDITLISSKKLNKSYDDCQEVECTHCEQKMIDEDAHNPEHYNRPFDEYPNDERYCSMICQDADEGRIYSKDFGYEYCETCGRTICEQNPGNGWHSQFKVYDGWMECNKCFQDRMLADGFTEDDMDREGLNGDFFEYNELEENGWKKSEDKFISSADSVESCKAVIKELKDQGFKVLLNIDRMAYGGSEGSVSTYIKSKDWKKPEESKEPVKSEVH